jgi:hypothetical protein
MFGKKNFTNTQIKGRIVNPDDDILINTDSNNLSLLSKYKIGDRNLNNKSVTQFRDNIDNIKLYHSTYGLLDTSGTLMTPKNKHLEDGLVAWYHKNIDVNSGYITDKSGNGVNGSLTSINNNETGLLYFDGTNDYITGSSKAIKTEGSNVSISVWVKPNGFVAPGNKQFILGQVNTSATSNSSINKDYNLLITSNNTVYFEVNSDDSYNSLTGSQSLISKNWNHIVCTYDNTSTKIYLNGSLIGFNDFPRPTMTSVYNLTIARGSTNYSKFNGYMRNIRVYNRAIETNEIVDLYNNESVSSLDDNNNSTLALPIPKIHLKMQEGSGNYITNYGTNTSNNYVYTSTTWLYKNTSCIYFDGTDDDFTINHTANLNGPLTLSVWYRKDTDGDSTYALITKHYRREFELWVSDGIFTLYCGNNTIQNRWGIDYPHERNVWYHIAVTRENDSLGYQSIIFYVNGKKYQAVKQENNISSGTIYNNISNGILIGCRVGGSSRFKGYMKNIRIYNSELTEQEILKIYKQELHSSTTTNILPVETNENLKKISINEHPEATSALDNTLLLNLTGQDDTSTEYITDYSPNNHNAIVSDGSITYSSSNATAISANKVIVFDNLSYASIDGSKLNSVALKALNYSNISFSGWIYLYDINDKRAIFSNNMFSGNIYNCFIDLNGRINVISNTNNTTIFNKVLSTSTWYNIIITYNYGKLKCFVGTSSIEPSEVEKYEIQSNMDDDTLSLYTDPYQEIEISNDNLVAQYNFNGNSTTSLTDYSRNGLNATMNNFSSSQVSENGYIFDGTDTLIILPNNDAFYTKNITFSILFKIETTSRTELIRFNQGIDLSFSGYFVRLDNNEIQFKAETYKETTNPGNDYNYRVSNSVSNGYSTNTLTFLTFVLDGAGDTFSLKIYKNGQKLNSSVTDNSAGNNFEWPTVSDGRISGSIGGIVNDNRFKLLGTVYNVSFYNTVLTDEQISYLYNTTVNNVIYNNSLQIAKGRYLNNNIYFKGEMDDIKIYTKTLTPAEIINNWNSGAVNYFSTQNNSTDLMIKLDGDRSDYFNELVSVLYLKINEGGSGSTLYDYGNYNNGNIVNNPTWSNSVPSSFFEKSLFFDGIDDYAYINSTGSVNLASALTISCWIYAYNDNNENVLFSKTYLNEFDMRFRSLHNDLRIYFGNGSQYETFTSESFSGILNYNAWNHLVITRDTGAAVLKDVNGYINGIHINFTKNNDGIGNLTISSSSNNIDICKRSGGSLYCRAGIADFRIYNRELNEKAVVNLYNSYFNDGEKNLTSLITNNNITTEYTDVGNLYFSNINAYKRLYLKLNEGSGNIVYDYQYAYGTIVYDNQYRYGNGTINGCNWALNNTIHYDNSLYFDGTDDYVNIYNNNNLTYNLSNALTVSLWVKLDDLSGGQTFFSKHYTGEFELAMFNNTIVFFDGNFSSYNNYQVNKADVGIQSGVWTHIVVTRNTGSTDNKIVFLYINGHRYYMTPIVNSNVVLLSYKPINIGRRSVDNTNYLHGYISQFMIFARKLTDTEVLDLYNFTDGWTSLAKYGNTAYDLNDSRELTITTNETNSICSGELWIKPSRVMQQIILKSNYMNETTRSNGDIKLELVPADSNNDELIVNWQLFKTRAYSGNKIRDYTGNNNDIYMQIGSESNIQRSTGVNLNKTLFDFDGTDDFSLDNLSNDKFYNDFGTAYNNKTFSISAWVHVHTNNTKTILCMTSNTSYRFLFLYIDTSERINFKIRGSDGAERHYYTIDSIPTYSWVHITLVCNGPSYPDIRIHVNGVSWTLNTNNSLPNLYNFPSTLYLRLGSAVSEFYYRGTMTDLRIYSKYLYTSEIREIMKQQYKPQLSIKLGGSTVSISNNNAIIEKDNWAHLAYNYNSTTNTMELYMNGKEIAKTTTLTNAISVNNNITLGDYLFEGQINNYSLYSRNLTANEIKYIYLGLDRLKLQLTGQLKKNNIFTSDIILLNKAHKPSDTYIHPYGSGLTLISKDSSFSNVLSFDGSTSYILLDPESDLWRCRSFTFAMWIKPDSTGSGSEKKIFDISSKTSISKIYYFLAYDYNLNRLLLFLQKDNDNFQYESIYINNIEPDIYTHITISIENYNINVFVNGAFYTSENIDNILNMIDTSDLRVVIGHNSTLASGYKGYIYDFRYYDTNLSFDAVRIIYSGYELNNVNNTNNLPELEYLPTDLNTVRNKDFVQPDKSSLKLHLNNYTTGTLIESSTENSITATATSMNVSTTEFDFNGSSSYLSIANYSDLNISGSSLTISMWINADTLAGSTYRLLMKGSTDNYGLSINSDNKVVFNISSTVTATSTTIITTGSWYHITAIFDDSNLYLYINGSDDSATVSGLIPPTVPNTGTGIYIGATTTPNNYFDGKIRDIRIYNTVLSIETIKLIYNAGLTTDGEFSIADNKKIENVDRYVYVSKYLIDDNGETTDILGDISRDNLLVHFNGSNTGTTYLDQSTLAIPTKMISLRPNYLSSDKILNYSSNDGLLSSVGLISDGTGTINSNTVLFNGSTSSNIILSGVEDKILEAWTFSTWYKLTSPTSKNIFLSRKETNKNLDLFIDSADNEIKIKYNTTTVSSDFVIDTTDYEWHHLAISKGQEGIASNIVSFYIDGELINQKRIDTTLTTSATSLLIGTDNTTGFNGYMDELRLYSSKLNSVEVKRLYNNNTIGGPIHYWLMEDDTSGITVRDSGSAGNNLCLQGSGTTFDTTTANVYYGTRSLKFEGTTSNFASSASVGVLGDQGRCISMWFKRSTTGDEANVQELLSYGNSSIAGEQFSVVINTSSNIQVNIGSTSNIRGTTRINDTDWHHLTILQLSPESGYYSDDRAIKILVDTINCTDTSSYTQTSINTRITGASDLLTIGKGFKGYINEASMFNYSLSKPEIDTLYANKNHYMLNLN